MKNKATIQKKRLPANPTVCGLLLLFMCSPGAVQARNPEIVPASLATCNGTSWSGLVWGRTTAQEIKKQFKTGRSDLPMSQELSLPRGTRQQIFALFADKHDDSPLEALLIRYSDGGPNLADLSQAFRASERDYYKSGRLEDWKIAAFPSRGMIAFEFNDQGQVSVPVLMLCPPKVVAAVCRELSSRVQPVIERIDPHANEPRVMQFGSAFVQTDLKGLDLKDGERQNVERTMIDTTAGGTMRYVVGAPGSYLTKVQGSFTPDRGGSLSVTCTISGNGPYGFITAEGSSNKSLPSVKDMATAYSGVNSTNYTVALYEALEQASTSFHNAMMASGPPSLRSIRAQQWQQLMDDLRDRSREAALSMPDPSFAQPPAAIPPPSPFSPPAVSVAVPAPAPAQSLFTFANGAKTVGTLVGFDGSIYTVSTPKGMRRFRAAGIKSIQALGSATAAQR